MVELRVCFGDFALFAQICVFRDSNVFIFINFNYQIVINYFFLTFIDKT